MAIDTCLKYRQVGEWHMKAPVFCSTDNVGNSIKHTMQTYEDYKKMSL
jgi:hypothetical protein